MKMPPSLARPPVAPRLPEEGSLKDIQTEFKACVLLVMKHREGGKGPLVCV